MYLQFSLYRNEVNIYSFAPVKICASIYDTSGSTIWALASFQYGFPSKFYKNFLFPPKISPAHRNRLDFNTVVILGNVSFEVFTPAIIQIVVFRAVTPCSLAVGNKRFRGACYCHL
jgi:hypothetical protein